MIGVLCSNNRERGHAEKLHSLYRKIKKQNDQQIIVFTISNIDFADRTVSGILISGEKNRSVKERIPSVIFNLSMQRDKGSIKKEKILAGMDGVTLINSINRFNQWMIMEILMSSRIISNYLLPFHIYNKKKRDFKPDDDKSYIAMPSRGSSLSRIIYAEPESETDRIQGSQYFKKGHICDYIDASLCQKRWIFMELPDILVFNNYPVVARVNLQKDHRGTWMILGKDIYPRAKGRGYAVTAKADEASLLVVNHINKFISSLGHCFIDFIIDNEGNPFFLHLGGFNHNFLYQQQDEDFYKNFLKNLLNLGSYCIHGEGGIKYVD